MKIKNFHPAPKTLVRGKKLKIQKYCGGQAVMTAVILLLSISLFVFFGAAGSALIEAKTAGNLINSKKSYFLAEAGGEDAIFRIKNGRQTSAEEIINLGGGSVTTNITDVSGDKKITSAGQVSAAVRRLEFYLSVSVGADFYYGAQVGEGGLEMNQNSRVEGAAGQPGNVYSNGSVLGSSGATITGDVTVASGISEDGQASSTVCNQDETLGKENPRIDFAQSFQPSASAPLAKVSLYIKKVGSPEDRDVRIAADAGGWPAQSALASGKLFSNRVGSQYAWVDIVFSSPANLVGGETYWIILDASRDSNKYWLWCKDGAGGYGNGLAKFSQDWDDDPWTSITGDLNFKTFLGLGLSSIDDVVVLGTARVNAITNSKICGDVYYQTIDPSSFIFLNDPSSPTCPSPLTPGTGFGSQPDPPVANMPLSAANIADFKASAEAGGVISGNCGDGGAAQCSIGDDQTLFLGPKKINGNLILTKKQTLVVTGGPLYFTGYLDLNSSSGAAIKCDASFGSQGCVIIFDSWVHIQNNALFQGSGQSGSYLMIISTLDGCVGGEQQPQCTHHNAALDIHNNATGAIFYLPYSLANLHNGVNVTEITAYKLRLDNNAVVTYEEGLSNSQFSLGPSGGWQIENWQETY